MKKITLIISFFLMLIVFSSCLDMTKPSSDKAGGRNTSFKRVKIDSTFTLNVPKYMKKTDQLNDDAALQYMNVFKDVYVIVIYEPISDVKNTFQELGEYDTIKSADRNYKDIQLKFIKETVGNYKTYDDEYLTINDLNASLVKLDGEVEGYNISYSLAFIEGKENVFMIMSWSETDKKNRYRSTFQKIAESFKLQN